MALKMIEKRRILHIITSLGIGGNEKLLYELIKYQKNIYDVSVAYLKDYGPIGEKIKQLDVDVEEFRGIFGVFRLIFFVRRFQPHYIHTHLYRACLIGRFVSLFKKSRVIVFSSQQACDFWKSRFMLIFDKLSLKLVDKVIANSYSVKKVLVEREKIDSGKISVVYNGADQDIFSVDGELRKDFNLGKEKVVVGFIGRLHKEKGAELLPNIIKAVVEKSDNILFLIVGRGPLERHIRKKINDMNLRDKVRIVGWRDDMPEIFNTIDICLVPSAEEGFGQVCLEAMSAGKPVIASRVGGVVEVVEDSVCGYLIEPGDVGAAVGQIIKLSKNKKLRDFLGDNGKRIAKKFSLEKMLSGTEDVYKEFN